MGAEQAIKAALEDVWSGLLHDSDSEEGYDGSHDEEEGYDDSRDGEGYADNRDEEAYGGMKIMREMA